MFTSVRSLLVAPTILLLLKDMVGAATSTFHLKRDALIRFANFQP